MFFGIGIVMGNTAQWCWKVFCGVETSENDGLV